MKGYTLKQQLIHFLRLRTHTNKYFIFILALLLTSLLLFNNISGCYCSCFRAGTLISTPSGPVPIESLKIGDLVLSFDHQSNQLRTNTVTAIFRHHFQPYGKYVFGHDLVIYSTSNHPFYNPQLQKYVPISTLSTRSENTSNVLSLHPSRLQSTYQKISLKHKEIFYSVGTVYNISVSRDQNYFANGILVHNKSEPPRNNYLHAYLVYPNEYRATAKYYPMKVKFELSTTGPNIVTIQSMKVVVINGRPDAFSVSNLPKLPIRMLPNELYEYEITITAHFVGKFEGTILIFADGLDDYFPGAPWQAYIDFVAH